MNNIQYYTRENQYGKITNYASFNGIEFYKHKEYYLNNTYGRMHRYIYEYYHGPIQEGYHVHHKDFDKNNNNINNITMLTRAAHMKLHKKGNKNRLGKHHTETTKEKISENHADVSGNKNPMYGKTGNKNPAYKLRTPQMIEDIKNGMGQTEFKRKYNCSNGYYYNTKKELEAGLYN